MGCLRLPILVSKGCFQLWNRLWTNQSYKLRHVPRGHIFKVELVMFWVLVIPPKGGNLWHVEHYGSWKCSKSDFLESLQCTKLKHHAVWQVIVLHHFFTRRISHRRMFLYGLPLEHQVQILRMDQRIWMDQNDQNHSKTTIIHMYIYIYIIFVL